MPKKQYNQGYTKGIDYLCRFGPGGKGHIVAGPHKNEQVDPKDLDIGKEPGFGFGLHSYKGTPVSDGVCDEHARRLLEGQRRYSAAYRRRKAYEKRGGLEMQPLPGRRFGE